MFVFVISLCRQRSNRGRCYVDSCVAFYVCFCVTVCVFKVNHVDGSLLESQERKL